MSTETLYKQVEDQGALFNVRTEPMLTTSGVRIPNKVAIINEASNHAIGVVSEKYQVVTNEQVLTATLEALDVSTLDLADATATVRSSHGGARTMLDIILPAHEINLNGDVSQMRISALNSYDGRWQYQTRAGAIRMACLNGQIMGSFVGAYTEYHNAKLDVKTSSAKMVEMLDGFHGAKEWWGRLMSQKVTHEDVLNTVSTYVDRQPMAKIEGEELAKFMKRRAVSVLVDKFETYAAEMGHTAYALYNALTDEVTHAKRNDDTAASSLKLAEDRLSETLKKLPLFA